MSWKHEYLERAQRIANMPTSPERDKAWNELEDDILGKISIQMASDLYDFCIDIPCAGSMVVMDMLPYEVNLYGKEG